MKVSLIIFKLVFLGALFIISNQNLHLSVPNERAVFIEDYNSWLRTLYNQGVEVMGYVVRSEWLPIENSIKN
ncbi:MAG: hypothetical protein AABX83_03655 [Nanoarchaeota archaeon]